MLYDHMLEAGVTPSGPSFLSSYQLAESSSNGQLEFLQLGFYQLKGLSGHIQIHSHPKSGWPSNIESIGSWMDSSPYPYLIKSSMVTLGVDES